jgi:anthranilate synthase component 1
VVGYLDFSGNLDTAIAIRTMTVCPDGRASVQAGAGIVADSDPTTENEECAHKAAAMLSAVAMARAAGAASTARAAGAAGPARAAGAANPSQEAR